MSVYRSKLYEQIRDEVYDTYSAYPPPGEWNAEWRKTWRAKWRNRVGFPRLIADRAISEAAGLLRSINLSVFKSDPDLAKRLLDLRAALLELAIDVGQSNLARVERVKSKEASDD